jgi:hypothetical protein
MDLGNIGSRGLVVYDEKEKDPYLYVSEVDWKRLGTPINPPPPALANLQALQVLVAPTNASLPVPGFFLNLDEIALSSLTPPLTGMKLGAAAARSLIAVAPAGAVHKWSIVINETGGALTEVPNTLFSPLSPGSRGNAAVLVTRGALVASIPANNIPSGSFCVLLNKSGLK